MSLKIEMAIREGWKATQNDRFGEVIEWRFIDTNTNKIMFRYAPKLEDEKIFIEGFEKLKEYDLLMKRLKDVTCGIEGRAFKIYGECKRETQEVNK